MKKIYKSNLPEPSEENPADKLAQYLRQTVHKERMRNIGKGTLALLAPLAANALLSNHLNAQCIFVNSGIQYLDIDEDGHPSFAFRGINANFQVMYAGFDDPGQIYANYTGGYYYAASIGSATTVVTGFATLNYFGGDNIPNPGTGNVTVIDANNNIVNINLTLNGATITINTVGGTAPTICAPVVPIEMTHFNLAVKENSLQLNWQTATETNNSGFEIQRSTDGVNFYKIGWADGEGTTTDIHDYGFEDKTIKTNVPYYYRLQQVDFDGTSTLSGMVSGTVEGDKPVQFGDIYPNPVSVDDAQVEVIVKETGKLTYALYDQLGKVVLEGSSDLNVGLNQLNIPVQQLAAGSYYLKMNTGEVSAYKKFVKE